ncbi:RNA polymerase alpha subunit C-terminal domain-containing protein [Flavobacterium granuli]|uniref:RecB family nuclease n=1 Tax=Flavobacterium granuli TaxID=280093 RepID=A0ABU1RXC2_9FLAO|nr:RNA polymerase alpha subunit C-terminal domain-containing protein [Flavobacterium granuli]MDR6843411.1 putative RecB family nuclease [Flavobacterium granuli]
MSQKNLRTCENGHNYYKSSDCPTCPICEAQRKPKEGFLSLLSAPARRALENAGITTLIKLSKHCEEDILKLHGIGKTAILKLREALASKNLTFAKQNQ